MLIKVSLCLIFVSLTLASIVLAQTQTNCKTVWPQFGVVDCEVFYGSTPQSEQKTPTCSGNDCSFSFSCAGRANCEIPSTNIQLSCGTGYCLSYTITKDGSQLGSYGSCFSNNPPAISQFSTATISGTCKLLGLGGLYQPFSSGSKVIMNYQNIYLYDTNPDYPKHKVDASVGCVPNGIMYKSGYTSQLPSSWIDSNGNTGGSKPSNLVDTLPTNMAVGDTYSYFYKYIEVSGINVVIGKDGNPVGYCGGSLGNRQLLSYSQITSSEGCYIIPTSFQKKVDCCANEDCKWKDPSGKLLCDPTTFTCTDKVPCNSDIECQVPWQSAGCTNKVETSWKCDLNQKWYPKQGTCVMTTKNVPCCTDSDCSSNQFCDKETGCQSKYVVVDCPSGKCCESGGNYKSQACSSGQLCCHSGDTIVGECKQSCEPPKTSQSISKGINITMNGMGNFDIAADIFGIPLKFTVGKDYKSVQESSPIALGPIIGLAIKYLPTIISLL